MSEKALGACRLSTKGQVTLPAEARRRFHFETGDLLLFVERDGELLVRKA